MTAFFGKPAHKEVWVGCDSVCGMLHDETHGPSSMLNCTYRSHKDHGDEDTESSYFAYYCKECWPTVPACGYDDCPDCHTKSQTKAYQAWWAIAGPHWKGTEEDEQCVWFKGNEPKVAAKPAKPAKTAAKPKAAPKVVKEKRAWAVGAGEPTAEDYRLPAEDIRADLCQARVLRDSDWDDRYSPRVYPENQCNRKADKSSEHGLCSMCDKQRERVCGDGLEATELIPGKPHKWCGLITAAPPGYVHMLGTDWHDNIVHRKGLKFADE